MGRKLSTEKIKELEEKIISMPEASNEEIASLVGIGTSSVSTYRIKLIQDGRLKQKEVVTARRNKNDKAKSKVQASRKKEILECLEKGKYYEEIREQVGISVSTIGIIVRELIENGETTKERIEFARERRKQAEKEAEKQTPQEIQEITEELMQKVLGEMQNGLIGRRITKKLGLGKGIFAKIRRKLINTNKITPEEAKRAQFQRRCKDQEMLYELRLQGYSIREILGMIEDSEEDYLIELEKELKEIGRLSDEDIEKAKYERKYRQISDFVLDGYKRKLNAREISEAYEIVYGERLGQRNVRYYKEKLVNSGALKDEDIEDTPKKRRRTRNASTRI